jgi:hypothetical protein
MRMALFPLNASGRVFSTPSRLLPLTVGNISPTTFLFGTAELQPAKRPITKIARKELKMILIVDSLSLRKHA